MSARDDAYHWLRPDTDTGPRVAVPDALAGIDLDRGRWLDRALPAPLSFTLDVGAKPRPAPHWIGARVPLVSDLFVSTLKRAGVDNFQTFPALLKNGKSAEPAPGHVVFNVVGTVDGADPEASVGEVMIEEDPGPKLVEYSKLVLARARTHDLDMFRLADCPSMLLVHDRVLRALRAATPPEGWGWTPLEIELI